MVENGCLDEVDEVYGFHQWPTAPLGQLWCKEGPVMSEITILEINIIGTSGHGS
jgi:metal-dependent amidase/aminoacylase/carboxypeptidase family protein